VTVFVVDACCTLVVEVEEACVDEACVDEGLSGIRSILSKLSHSKLHDRNADDRPVCRRLQFILQAR
jgi:hypothetical protein